MKKKSCTKPASVMVKLGNNEPLPLCESHMEDARSISAKGGKVKGVDKVPVAVRPLTEIERENKPRCLISSLGGG